MARVLLAHALDFPNIGRLCVAFRGAGVEVGVLAVKAHPIHQMHAPHQKYLYNRRAPCESVCSAFEAFRPDLIIPCDDRVVHHLCSLYRMTTDGSAFAAAPDGLGELIETSIGRPVASGVIANRCALDAFSKLPDVCVPKIDKVESPADIRKWAEENGLPALLKIDGSWGGNGVFLLRCEAEIEEVFFKMRIAQSGLMRLKRLLFNRDIEGFLSPRRPEAVNVQAFVAGRSATLAVACWRGEVIAHIAAEVVLSRGRFRKATVVRIVEGDAMIAAARSIARYLSLSGFHGFDFVLDDNSGKAHLVEINPRATQLDHLPLGIGHDLVTAVRDVLTGEAPGDTRPPLPCREVALFPGEWHRDRRSKYLYGAFHDVPREEPEFVHFYGYPADIIV